MTFAPVKHTAQRVVQCPSCSKYMRRSKQFMQTVNPFNTGADGQVKTALQIREELVQEGKRWKEQAKESTEACSACLAAQAG